MARPKASPEQHVAAYLMYMEGNGPKAIYEALYKEWRDTAPRIGGMHLQGTMVSERTMSTWLNGFKSLSATILILDSPFKWHRMDTYSLPWEASAYLMEILLEAMPSEKSRTQITLPGAIPFQEAIPNTSFTGRIAQWCWRVHLAAPEIGTAVGKQSDVHHIAKQFATREMTAEVLGEPLNMEDLEAILLYKPWLDDNRHQAYHQTMFGEIVPPLFNQGGLNRESLSLAERFMDAILDPILRPADQNHEDHQELLLSQQSKYRS